MNAKEIVQELHNGDIHIRVEGSFNEHGCLVDGKLSADPASKIGDREKELIAQTSLR
jgi:hypothetical protein